MTLGNQQQQHVYFSNSTYRERIWRGTLEWNDKQNQQNTTRQIKCEIYASVSKDTNELEVRGDSWPTRLIMQLMPRAVITNVGGHLLRVSFEFSGKLKLSVTFFCRFSGRKNRKFSMGAAVRFFRISIQGHVEWICWLCSLYSRPMRRQDSHFAVHARQEILLRVHSK
jgi:hypothetical protein